MSDDTETPQGGVIHGGAWRELEGPEYVYVSKRKLFFQPVAVSPDFLRTRDLLTNLLRLACPHDGDPTTVTIERLVVPTSPELQDEMVRLIVIGRAAPR